MQIAEYTEMLIKQHAEQQKALVSAFEKRKRENEKKIEEVLEQAGVFQTIENLKEDLKKTKTSLQSQVDSLSGKIAQLREIQEKFLLAPIPEGVTHMHGIELFPLDWRTRIQVMNGEKDTIEALGGKLEEPEEVDLSEFELNEYESEEESEEEWEEEEMDKSELIRQIEEKRKAIQRLSEK